jgi:hypothetical protein
MYSSPNPVDFVDPESGILLQAKEGGEEHSTLCVSRERAERKETVWQTVLARSQSAGVAILNEVKESLPAIAKGEGWGVSSWKLENISEP